MVALDPTVLAELRDLVIALAEDIQVTRAAGYRTLYSGEDLRRHFRELVQSAGLDAALVEAHERYQLQLAGDLLPLVPPSDVPQTDSSSDPRGAR